MVVRRSDTVVSNVRFINCTLRSNSVKFLHVKEQGIEYPRARLLFSGTSFQNEIDELVSCEEGTGAILTVGAPLNNSFETSVSGDVTVKSAYISIKY